MCKFKVLGERSIRSRSSKSMIKSEINLEFDGVFKLNTSGEFEMDLQYGYEFHWSEPKVEQFDSVIPGQTYRIMRQTQPKEGDIIMHIKSGRKFILGKDLEGFIVHKFPLIDISDNSIKAYVRSEDYYKD